MVSSWLVGVSNKSMIIELKVISYSIISFPKTFDISWSTAFMQAQNIMCIWCQTCLK
jgi:hypothetical protein